MLVYQKTTYCYKHVRVSAWLSGKPSVQDIINSYINENTGSNLEKSQKKGFEIRALKIKKYLGVVPKKTSCSSAAERLQHRRLLTKTCKSPNLKMVIAL